MLYEILINSFLTLNLLFVLFSKSIKHHIIICILQTGRLRNSAQGHIASLWRSQYLNSHKLIALAKFKATLLLLGEFIDYSLPLSVLCYGPCNYKKHSFSGSLLPYLLGAAQVLYLTSSKILAELSDREIQSGALTLHHSTNP